MIQIQNLSGQLGNRLLRLNNGLQLSKKNKLNLKLMGSDDITKDILKNFNIDKGSYKDNGKIMKIKNLGEKFYDWDYYDPRELIKIRENKREKFNNNKINIGIHIRYPPKGRGERFPVVRDEKILEEYYINSIKFCVKEYKNPNFIIFGPVSKNQFRKERDNDQLTAFITKFKFYTKMIKYLENNNISFDFSITIKNNKEHYMRDFLQLCECDVLISSYSTFSICAGFLGKNKKIIHSKQIIEHYKNKKDKFWVDLYNGGNQYYKLWKLI